MKSRRRDFIKITGFAGLGMVGGYGMSFTSLSQAGESFIEDVELLAEVAHGTSVVGGIASGKWYAGVLKMQARDSYRKDMRQAQNEGYDSYATMVNKWADETIGKPRKLVLLREGQQPEVLVEAERIYGPVAPKTPVQAALLAWTELANDVWRLRVFFNGRIVTLHETPAPLTWPAIAADGKDVYVACQTIGDEGPMTGLFNASGQKITVTNGRHPKIALHSGTAYLLSEVSTAREIRSKVDVVVGRRIVRTAWVPQDDVYALNGDVCIDPESNRVYVVTETAPPWSTGKYLGLFRKVKCWQLSDGNKLKPWPAPGCNAVPGAGALSEGQDKSLYPDWSALQPVIFCQNGNPAVAYRKAWAKSRKENFHWHIYLCKSVGKDWMEPVRLTDQECLPDTNMSFVPNGDNYLVTVTQYKPEFDDSRGNLLKTGFMARVYRFGPDHKLQPYRNQLLNYENRKGLAAPAYWFGLKQPADTLTDIAPAPPALPGQPKGKILVWGDIHRHTDYSKCVAAMDGTPVECVRFQRDVLGCQVIGISEHTDRVSETEWLWVLDQLEQECGADNLVLLYGTEPPTHPNRHTNYYTINRRNAHWLLMAGGFFPDGVKRAQIYRLLLEKEPAGCKPAGSIMAVRHFHGSDTSVSTYEPRLEAMMEAQQIRSDAMLTTYRDQKFPNVFLHRGHKVGLCGGSDHSSVPWNDPNQYCLTGFWVDDLSPEAVWKAMNNRQTLSCANGKIAMYASLNGKDFGQAIKVNGPVKIRASVSSARPLRRIALMRDGEILQWQPLEGTATEVELVDGNPGQGDHWYAVIAEAGSAYKDTPAVGYLSPFFTTNTESR